MVVTGHLGNWELGGSYVAARGVPLEAVARRMENPLFDHYLTETRRRIGMTVIHDADAVRRVPRALREEHAVAFLVDQGAVGLASTWVPFFGRYAKTPRGPAVFALRLRAPLLFACALRQPSGRFALHFEEVPRRADGHARCRRGPHRRRVHEHARALGSARARAILLASPALEASAAGHAARAGRSVMNERVKRALRRDPRAWFGVGVVVLIVLLAVLAPLVSHARSARDRSRQPAAGSVARSTGSAPTSRGATSGRGSSTARASRCRRGSSRRRSR